MALFVIRACDRCGADVWKLNRVDHDRTARVTSYSCLHCGHMLYRVQHYRAPRKDYSFDS